MDVTWPAVAAWAADKLNLSRELNENPRLDPIETALLRGRISVFKELLALPKDLAARAQQDDPA